MFTNKKSEMGIIATMIIILVCAFVLIIVITQAGKKMGLEGAIEACRFSVIAQSYTTIKPTFGGLKSPLDVECNTRYVTFKNTEVLTGLDPDVQKPIDVFYNDKKVKKFSNLNEYVVNQVVAEEMRVCWFEFGEAQTTVFPNTGNLKDKLFQTNDDICFVCSHIRFDIPNEKKFDNLVDFLNRTTVQSEGMTYLKYFSKPSLSDVNWEQYTIFDPDGKLKDVWGDNPISKISLDSKNSYVVIFRKDYDSNLIYALVGGIPGLIAGAAGNKDGYYVYMIPDTKVGDVCDIMAS